MVQTAIVTSVPERRCAVLRPIFVGGVRQEVGAVLTLPGVVYAELQAAGKVGPAPADPPPAPAADAVPPAEDTAATRAQRAKKE